jgi:predicted acetyltransferase
MDTPTDKTKDEERAKKRSTLAYLQDLYDKDYPVSAQLKTSAQKTYDKYGIKSRTELTDAQLDYEIESYKTALQNNAA